MTTELASEFTSFDQRAIIKVCGVGGGGGNAVGRMIEAGLDTAADFIAINTDAQALKLSPAATRLQIGADITGGLGSGAMPEIGRQAALEDRERIREMLGDADMVFLTAGLGGGTGTGGAPIIAEAARESGALTVAIVTLPFGFEGPERMANARQGLDELKDKVDTLIVVPNDRITALSQDDTHFLNAFRRADEVLYDGVRAIVEVINVTGHINVDFADVRSVMRPQPNHEQADRNLEGVQTMMQGAGRALMGIGVAEGDGRVVTATQEAMVCPLLEHSSIAGATGVIVNITGGRNLTMHEINEAASAVRQAAHPRAHIFLGVVHDPERPDVQVTVIAAGFAEAEDGEPLPPEESASDSGEAEHEQAVRGQIQTGASAPAVREEDQYSDPPVEEPRPRPSFPEEEAEPPAPEHVDQPRTDIHFPTFMWERRQKERVLRQLHRVGETELKRLNAESHNDEVKHHDGRGFYREVTVYEGFQPLRNVRRVGGSGSDEGYVGYIDFCYRVYRSQPRDSRRAAEMEPADIPQGETHQTRRRYSFTSGCAWDGAPGEPVRD